MKTRVITTEEEFLSLKDAWNSLLEKSSNDVVHLSHEWTTAWWRSFGEGSTPNIILVYNGEEIIGIAPIISWKGSYRGVGVRKVSFMVNGHSPSVDIIAKSGFLEEVTRSVMDRLTTGPGWDIIEIEKIDSGGPTYEAVLDYLARCRLRFGIRDNIETPYVPIDSTWDEFFKKRGKRFRKSIRNKINRAGREEDMAIETLPLTSSDNGAFADIIKVSKDSWKRRIKADMSSNSHYYGFYKSIADLLGGRGLVSVWLLKKAGEPIAFELHLTYKDVVYPIRADYSRAFKSLSPGSVLEYNILKSLFNGSSVKEYNTCGHNYHYLMNWTDHTRKYKNIDIFRKGLRPYSLFILEYRLMPVLRKVKPAFIKELVDPSQENLK